MQPSSALSLRRVSVDDPIDTDHLLGAVTYGAAGCIPHPASFGFVPMPVLPDGGAVHAAWFAQGPFTAGSLGKLQYRCDKHVMFGFIALDEADFPPVSDSSAIRQASYAAYSVIFEAIRNAGFQHLVRCWNYLPRINVADNGLERYRQFNIGRQNAFIVAQRSHLVGSPSACALGTQEGGLVVYFLASRCEPCQIENPRQISAYHYPEQYGPRSPSFSRATLLPLPGREALFISGTASIVGHETLHNEDVAAQTAETLRNIEIVVQQANLKSQLGGFATRDLYMKVYIRHAQDLEPVARVLQEHLGSGIEATWFLADACRADLLVEIEAFGYRAEVLA